MSGDLIPRPDDDLEVRPAAELEQPQPVDPPPEPRTIHATITGTRVADRRPIVPAYLRSREERRQLAAWAGRYGAHLTAYHATRSPLYALRLAARAPWGAVVAVVALVGWVFDREGAHLRREAVAHNRPDDYLKLTKVRNGRVRQRGIITAVAAVPALTGSLLGYFLAPSWSLWAAGAVAVAVLGKVGTPADRRVTDAAVVAPAAPPRITAEQVTKALRALGLPAMNTKDAEIRYPAPITRDGPGWRADVDLPLGVTPGDVVERRDRLASGLRRPLSAVWPEPDAGQHAGRLVLWVGDRPLSEQKPPAWPLAKSGRVDMLGGSFPFGTDVRGRSVPMSLAESNLLVGSLPGAGKTSAVRVVALAAALDPMAELRVHEHKGSGDLAALEQVAHRYCSGVDDESIAATLASLRELHAELERRAKVLAGLPREVRPDNKVTPELAARRSLRLWTVVAIVDEAQEVFSHPDHGKEAATLAEAIIKRGRALGLVLVLATQRPDAKSLPTGVSSNVGVRFCLRVMDQVANDMILGTSAYKAGLRATTLSPRERGVGYLVGAADEPKVVRSYYLDAEDAERIALRARALREAAGTITGHAAGEDQAPDDDATGAGFLTDVRAVLIDFGQTWAWNQTVAGALAVRRPEAYAGIDAEQVGRMLAARGIQTRQLNRRDPHDGERRVLTGFELSQVDAAIERAERG